MKWFIKCLKQYADFNGRARRKEYWWFILIYFIIALICIIGWMMPFFKMGYEAGISGGAINIDEQEAALAREGEGDVRFRSGKLPPLQIQSGKNRRGRGGFLQRFG